MSFLGVLPLYHLCGFHQGFGGLLSGLGGGQGKAGRCGEDLGGWGQGRGVLGPPLNFWGAPRARRSPLRSSPSTPSGGS